ncbi:MAG: peptidylprolyl isomerase [Alphaproteobacteria bacterium]|nr:peptidylprolyl isomerase [Alphaproteobacteria bacterium]MDE2336038.1 peptidylprolyl isomerase [Alphaproteobacteria bacterium]
MTKRLLLLIAGLLLLLNGTPARAAVSDDIAAVVNSNIITLTDVKERTDLYLSGEKVPAAARQEMEQKVLNKLIDEKLELQEAKKLGITVDEAQVNNGFAFIARQNHLSPDAFKKQLTAAGVNIDTLYSQIKAEIAWEQVIQREIKPQINISESDIDMSMKKIAQSTATEYHIAEIMLGVPSANAKASALARAQDLVRKIRQGADFAKMARQYSQGAAAEQGGDLGWVEGGQLSPPLDQALKNLQRGQITDPVFANGGYHILFLLDTRETAAGDGGNADSAPASPVVTLKQIVIPFKPNDPPDVVNAKMARGQTLDGAVKSCADMDAQMKNFPYQGTGTLGRGPEDELPEPVRDIVAKLPVGQLSPPVRMPDGWAMIMVCARENAPAQAAAATAQSGSATAQDPSAQSPANLSLDEKERQNVADKLGMQRLDQMAAHYLSDLRAAAFIDRHI